MNVFNTSFDNLPIDYNNLMPDSVKEKFEESFQSELVVRYNRLS